MKNDVPDIAPICELCSNDREQLMNVRREYPLLWRPGRVTNMKELLVGISKHMKY